MKEREPAPPIKPNGERDANSQGRQKSASISAKSSKFEEKTIAIRSSLRVGALTSTKNRLVGSGQKTKRAREHPTHSGFNLPEKPPADPNVTKSGKRKCREELGQAVSKAKKLQRKSHEAETKFPNASIKSNSKNCLELDQAFSKAKKMASKKLPNASIKSKSKKSPVIKSSKKRYLMDCSSKSSSHLTRNDGLNSKDIKIVCFKEKKQISFFSKQFNGRIHRVEKTLNDQGPEKTVTYVREH